MSNRRAHSDDGGADRTVLSLTELAMRSSSIIGAALTCVDAARRELNVIVKRRCTASMLELLTAAQSTQAAVTRWRQVPAGWTTRVVVDGRLFGVERALRPGETWEELQRTELRTRTPLGVVHRATAGMGHKAMAATDAASRTLRVRVAWHENLTEGQSETLAASIEYWLGLWVGDGWAARVVCSAWAAP